MVPSSSLYSQGQPSFVILILSLITDRIMKIKTFLAAWIYVKCSCAPGCRDFSYLLLYSTGCREAIHNEFLLAEPCKCVTVSDVLKHLAADKCKEWWMIEWKQWKLRRISFKPMFLLSLLTNKDSYNTQIIQCVNDPIFRKRFRRYPVLEL